MRQLFVFALLVAPSGLAAAEPVRIALTPCPGQGYLAYRYPAVGSCPCVDESCFHPNRYYACCGDADPTYKKLFWKRWMRAHFRGGSLLDGVPCHCITPAAAAVPVPAIALPTIPPAPTEELQRDGGDDLEPDALDALEEPSKSF